MHPLLARGLEMGAHADGFTDDAGAGLRVEEDAALLRCEVRGPEDEVLARAWRWPVPPEEPTGGSGTHRDAPLDASDGGSSTGRPPLPDDVPLLPGLSGVAVRDAGGLTVSWPAPPPATGVPGGVGGGLPGASAAAPRDPVTEAWSRFRAEGGVGNRTPRLREALERLVEVSREEGWDVVEDEAMDAPLEARVVRMRRRGAERSLTLSRALGVSSLVMIEKAGGAGRARR